MPLFPSCQVTVITNSKQAYLTYGSMWVSIETPSTIYSKLVAAGTLNLGGVMVS